MSLGTRRSARKGCPQVCGDFSFEGPMISRLAKWVVSSVGAIAGAWFACGSAFAAGTAANTPITNSAQVSYTVGGAPVTVNSNTTTLNVAEILNVNVTV